MDPERERDNQEIEAPGREAVGPPVPGPEAAPRRGRRWLRWITWGVPLLALTMGGIALGLYIYVLSQVTVGTGEVAVRGGAAEAFGWPLRLTERVNILLIGIDETLDNRRRVVNVARADTLLLATFDVERDRMAALSIPRDTRAEIPRFGVQKINASYAYGGPRLTIRTVEQLVGVEVHYYVKLGANSFSRLIDAVGGVEVEVDRDMKYTDSWAGFRVDLKKGRQKLTGEQAMGFVRFRSDPLGDITRVDRQQRVLMSLLAQLRQPSTALAAPSLLKAFAENTETNLTPAQLMTLGFFAMTADGAPLRAMTLPGIIDELYYVPDAAKVREVVAEMFYGVTTEEIAGAQIEVVNASGTSGLGRQVAARIEALGFRTISVRASETIEERTTVINRTPRKGFSRMIARTLGKVQLLEEEPTEGPAVTVVVARDAVRGAYRMEKRQRPPAAELGRAAPEGVPPPISTSHVPLTVQR